MSAKYATEVSMVKEILGSRYSDTDVFQAVFLSHGDVGRAVDRLLDFSTFVTPPFVRRREDNKWQYDEAKYIQKKCPTPTDAETHIHGQTHNERIMDATHETTNKLIAYEYDTVSSSATYHIPRRVTTGLSQQSDCDKTSAPFAAVVDDGQKVETKNRKKSVEQEADNVCDAVQGIVPSNSSSNTNIKDTHTHTHTSEEHEPSVLSEQGEMEDTIDKSDTRITNTFAHVSPSLHNDEELNELNNVKNVEVDKHKLCEIVPRMTRSSSRAAVMDNTGSRKNSSSVTRLRTPSYKKSQSHANSDVVLLNQAVSVVDKDENTHMTSSCAHISPSPFKSPLNIPHTKTVSQTQTATPANTHIRDSTHTAGSAHHNIVSSPTTSPHFPLPTVKSEHNAAILTNSRAITPVRSSRRLVTRTHAKKCMSTTSTPVMISSDEGDNFSDEDYMPRSRGCHPAPGASARPEPFLQMNTKRVKYTVPFPVFNMSDKATKLKIVSEDDKTWPRRLGVMRVECFYTKSISMMLNPNSNVTFTFSKTIIDNKSSKTSRKKNSNASVLRLTVNGTEIGRVPVDIGRFLQPLVQSGKVTLSSRLHIGSKGMHARFNNTIPVLITLMVQKDMFAQVSSSRALSTMADFTDSKDEEGEALRMAMLDLLTYIGYIKNRPGSDIYLKDKPSNPDGEECELDEKIKNSLISTSARLVGADADVKMPSQLVTTLRQYQVEGVQWMLKREAVRGGEEKQTVLHPLWHRLRLRDGDDKNVHSGTPFYVNPTSALVQLTFPAAVTSVRGGILADEMGLGKTLQMLSVILSTMDEDKKLPRRKILENPDDESKNITLVQGGTLVVCPMSMLGQWQGEIDTHTREGTVRSIAYYGLKRAGVNELSIRNNDIVVTTYGVVGSEINKTGLTALKGINWKRIVLDEGHYIKGRTTQQAKGVYGLYADCRWVITGTPIQNRLDDLFSLLHFLQVDPWDDYNHWNKMVIKPFDSTDIDAKERAQAEVRTILSAIMLRREKSTKDADGQPIVNLPKKTIETLKLTASDEEKDFYVALYERCKTTFDTFVASNKVMSNFTHVLELLLRLRQCCDHPLLVLSAPSKDLATITDFDKFAQVFSKGTTQSEAFVRKTMVELKEGGLTEECPICLDQIDDAVFPLCGHPACRDCLYQMFGSARNDTIQCPICRVDVARSSLVTAPRASRFNVDLNRDFKLSTKMESLLDSLDNLIKRRREGDPHAGKAVVFSQWTSMLDLVEIPFKERKYNFVRLDGSTSQPKRVSILESFSSEKGNRAGSPEILIMSLRAGGVGLNLTEANYVYMMDMWWNPFVEQQCMDRVHRLGQKRPVFVTRYVIVGTVEERLLEVQRKKALMVEEAMSMDTNERKQVRLAEILHLFS
eukprot:CFRG6066T1